MEERGPSITFFMLCSKLIYCRITFKYEMHIFYVSSAIIDAVFNVVSLFSLPVSYSLEVLPLRYLGCMSEVVGYLHGYS